MLENRMKWMKISKRLEDEMKQCKYEGKVIDFLEEEAKAALSMEEGEEKEVRCKEIYFKLNHCIQKEDYIYTEPVLYEEIQKVLPADVNKIYKIDRKQYLENVKGAWYGRCIGCLLGIPVEGWSKEKITGFLQESGQYPLQTYIYSNMEEKVRSKYQVKDEDIIQAYDRKKICWRNNVSSFPVDDDTNYTIAALRLLEEKGRQFSSNDVLENWLFSFPFLHACSAEKVAYQNAINQKFAPESATYLNPYREWIGAQIRGDFFGYINPGNPHEAANMAYRDGAVSHIKNGIYGEMYIAALISLSAFSTDVLWNCKEALKQIPPKSRIAEDINIILKKYQEKKSYKSVILYIHEKYNQKDPFEWCYVNPNTMIVVASILWFSNHFSKAIIQTVLAGFDTDCNGATVGSILGMLNGFGCIEANWLEEMEPILNTSIHRYKKIHLDEIVDRTVAIAKENK